MLRKLIFIIAVSIATAGMSQQVDIYEKYNIYRNPFRVFINKFSWTITSGYGATDYKHNLDGFYFYQDGSGQYILSNQNELGALFAGYQNWVGMPVAGQEIPIVDIYDVPYNYLENPVNNPSLINRQFLADADTLGLTFSSIASTVPVLASVHYEFSKFRIGFGWQYERQIMTQMKPSVYTEVIRPVDPGFKQTSYTKWFGIVGYEFYDYWDYTFALEVQLGKATPGKEINTNAVGIGQNFFANVGVSIEHNLSEYFRVVIRPSYDFKRYVINLPDASSVRHTNNAFMIQGGISINIPEIPRSPMKSDHVQLKHVITDPKSGRLMEVRGQPIWKKQNPKVGQNHRRLWRYKWRNRRKIDPY